MENRIIEAVRNRAAQVAVTEAMEQRWLYTARTGDPLKTPFRMRRGAAAALALAGVLLLAGFVTVASGYFDKLFVQADLRDYALNEYIFSSSTGKFVEKLAPGEVAETTLGDIPVLVVRGDTMDRFYGKIDSREWNTSTVRNHDWREWRRGQIVASHTADFETVEEWAADGRFIAGVQGEEYKLTSIRCYEEMDDIVLNYSIDGSRSFQVELRPPNVYYTYEDESRLQMEEVEVNSRVFLYVERDDNTWDSRSLSLYLGENRRYGSLNITGHGMLNQMEKEELVEIAEGLVFYNEEANRPVERWDNHLEELLGAVDDPVLHRQAETIRAGLEKGEAGELWSDENRTVTYDAEMGRRLNVAYTGLPYSEAATMLELAGRPLEEMDWFPAERFSGMDVYSWGDAAQWTLRFGEGREAAELISCPMMEEVEPQTELDALVVGFDFRSADDRVLRHGDRWYAVSNKSDHLLQDEVRIGVVTRRDDGFVLHTMTMPAAWLRGTAQADWLD